MTQTAMISRRALLAALGGLGAGAVLAACTDGGSDGTKVPSLDVPQDLPATFASTARWQLPTIPGGQPASLTEGVAVLTPGEKDKSKYRVQLVDPANGNLRWGTREFESDAPDAAVPVMSRVSAPSGSWVTVLTHSGPNTVRLDLYQAEGTGDRREPERSVSLEGPDPATLPRVLVGERGITATGLAGGNADAAYVLSMPTAEATPWSGPGTLVASWDEGQVATSVSERSGFGFVVGGETAWESADVPPVHDGDTASEGALLAVGAGVVLARWTVPDGTLVVAHGVRSGEVLAVVLARDGIVAPDDTRVIESPDGKWVAWGQYALGLKGATSRDLDLQGTRPVSLYRDALYVADSPVPLTAATSTASDGGGSSSSASDGGGGGAGSGRYGGLLDVQSGQWLTNRPVEAVPLFVSDASQGIFVIEDRGVHRVFSVPVA